MSSSKPSTRDGNSKTNKGASSVSRPPSKPPSRPSPQDGSSAWETTDNSPSPVPSGGGSTSTSKSKPKQTQSKVGSLKQSSTESEMSRGRAPNKQLVQPGSGSSPASTGAIASVGPAPRINSQNIAQTDRTASPAAASVADTSVGEVHQPSDLFNFDVVSDDPFDRAARRCLMSFKVLYSYKEIRTEVQKNADQLRAWLINLAEFYESSTREQLGVALLQDDSEAKGGMIDMLEAVELENQQVVFSMESGYAKARQKTTNEVVKWARDDIRSLKVLSNILRGVNESISLSEHNPVSSSEDGGSIQRGSDISDERSLSSGHLGPTSLIYGRYSPGHTPAHSPERAPRALEVVDGPTARKCSPDCRIGFFCGVDPFCGIVKRAKQRKNRRYRWFGGCRLAVALAKVGMICLECTASSGVHGCFVVYFKSTMVGQVAGLMYGVCVRLFNFTSNYWQY